jgi:hypothetical protein
MGKSYPKETLISLANSEKRKLQYRARTYGTPWILFWELDDPWELRCPSTANTIQLDWDLFWLPLSTRNRLFSPEKLQSTRVSTTFGECHKVSVVVSKNAWGAAQNLQSVYSKCGFFGCSPRANRLLEFRLYFWLLQCFVLHSNLIHMKSRPHRSAIPQETNERANALLDIWYVNNCTAVSGLPKDFTNYIAWVCKLL